MKKFGFFGMTLETMLWIIFIALIVGGVYTLVKSILK